MKFTVSIVIFIIHMAAFAHLSPTPDKPDSKPVVPSPMIDQIAEESFQGLGQIDTPLAQDRAEIEIRPKKRTKKINIYLDGPPSKKAKKPKKPLKLATTHAYDNDEGEEVTTQQPFSNPEVTTRADNHRYEDNHQSRYHIERNGRKKKTKERAEQERTAEGGVNTDAQGQASIHHEHYAQSGEIKEKTKVKHHHHHHHHNHIKTVVKKEPYPVEKIVHVPVEKVVPIEKVVEKVVHVPVPKPYPVEKIVHVPKIVEKPVDRIVNKPYPYPVRVPVPYPVEKIVEKPVDRIVHVPKIVEKKVPYEKLVPVEVPKPYPYKVEVERKIPVPYEVKVPVEVPVRIPFKVEVEKKVPYPIKVYVPQPYPIERKVPVPVEVSYKNNHDHDFEAEFERGFSSMQRPTVTKPEKSALEKQIEKQIESDNDAAQASFSNFITHFEFPHEQWGTSGQDKETQGHRQQHHHHQHNQNDAQETQQHQHVYSHQTSSSPNEEERLRQVALDTLMSATELFHGNKNQQYSNQNARSLNYVHPGQITTPGEVNKGQKFTINVPEEKLRSSQEQFSPNTNPFQPQHRSPEVNNERPSEQSSDLTPPAMDPPVRYNQQEVWNNNPNLHQQQQQRDIHHHHQQQLQQQQLQQQQQNFNGGFNPQAMAHFLPGFMAQPPQGFMTQANNFSPPQTHHMNPLLMEPSTHNFNQHQHEATSQQ